MRICPLREVPVGTQVWCQPIANIKDEGRYPDPASIDIIGTSYGSVLMLKRISPKPPPEDACPSLADILSRTDQIPYRHLKAHEIFFFSCAEGDSDCTTAVGVASLQEIREHCPPELST